MLSRKQALERRKHREWMCQAVGLIEGDGDIEREDHHCVLPKRHYGNHLCWCGWGFDDGDISWHQSYASIFFPDTAS